MRKVKYALLLALFSCTFFSLSAQHKFTIDLNDIADDQFKVTVIPDGLSAKNNIFQFAVIAPGTYQTMDIGRFVRSFKAFDTNGENLEVKQISTNQWKLSNPQQITKIEYSIAETWDTPVEENHVYNMGGTSLEKDHAYINNHCVLGYFHGMQSDELWLKLEHPEEWKTGTALSKNSEGFFVAPTYDFAVDSPILMGRLSKASINVEGTDVDVFTYSKTDMIKSQDILDLIEDILVSASKFIDGLPVDRYVFLYHFEDMDYGAWEHSYSSNYALGEMEIDMARASMLRSVAAHEFYHVVTPLNIHSELIETFNYETPELSQHLWLYEGVTEWAAITMQLRGGIITLDEYLQQVTMKLGVNDGFNPDISLTQLGEKAIDLQDQYVNIYHKGAVTAALLDLELLKKSKGKYGLRELVNELSDKYGPNKPFDEAEFFNELQEITYPEVGQFIDKYIKGTEPLPVEEYFNYVGIDYTEFAGYDSSSVSLGLGLTVVGTDIAIAHVNSETAEVMPGDIIKSIDGVELSLANVQEQFGKFHQLRAGDVVEFTLLRNDEEFKVDWVLSAKKIKHQFALMEKPKRKQLKLRARWMSNQ